MNDLRPGDVITIPSDQFGKPRLRVDPVTRKATKELREFIVAECKDGVITLVPK